jgi:hypothetical protein
VAPRPFLEPENTMNPLGRSRTRPADRAFRRAVPLSLVLGSLLLVVALPPRPARAWGREAHRASARLAETRLSASARAAVRELLEPGETLADASTWADEHSRDIPGSASWHFVNVPISAARYDRRFCARRGCVVSKIGEYRRVLAEADASRAERREALRFLVHFVQDVHQPLHVGDRDDRGGNNLQVRFMGEGSNLHRVWDSGLLFHAHTNERALVREIEALATPEQAERWSRGTVEDWANESLEAAKRAYLLPGTDRPIEPGDTLGRDYLEANLPVVRRRVAQSGVRVALVLNQLWD